MDRFIKSQREIATIRAGGIILHDILKRTAALVRPGISTWDLNDFAEKEMLKSGGKPSFKGYGPKGNVFPAALCTSINSVVVHGIPSKDDILREGDIVGLDVGLLYQGFYTDTAITVGVGTIDPQVQNLLDVTKQALRDQIRVAIVGNRIGDIGHVGQMTIEAAGFGVVRDLVGHGVGYKVHEDPSVPNYGKAGTGLKLEAGMVLAIEPMANLGNFEVDFEDDGWTVRTVDKLPSAHFEHTVAITEKGPEILT